MLWLKGYQTRRLDATEVPSSNLVTIQGAEVILPSCCVILGGFDLRAQAEIGIWRKLVEGRHIETPVLTVFLLDSMKPSELGNLKAMTPKSQWNSTLISDSSEMWRNVIQPDCRERSFAGKLQEGILNPLMVGPPTEEAWDEFSESI